MKITSMKTFAVENPPPARGGRLWNFVKLTTDNGISGWGEPWAVGFETKTINQLFSSIFDRYFLNADPFKIEETWRRVYSAGAGSRPDTAKMCILSAMEQACWDIIGKALDQPVYNLLGGRYHDRLRSYTYLYPPETNQQQMAVGGQSPAMHNVQNDPIAAGERAAYYLKLGFTAVKFDPAGPAFPLSPPQLSLEILENAEAVVKNVREALGDKADILIGTHGQMTTSSAIRLARRLEKYDPLWFEEPTQPENKNEMARVAHHTTVPIATGERLSTKYEFRELLECQAAQILQFALGRVGGILEAKKIAGMAEAYYAQIAPHLYAGPIEAIADIQVDTCSPNFLIQESIERFDGFHARIVKKPVRWEDGFIIPPAEPGLGIELDEAQLIKYEYKGE